jgi:aminoglycoside N3'-acetyltransferase
MTNIPSSASTVSVALASDFRRLGIFPGDTILIRGALSTIGRVSRWDFLSALLSAVGPAGTIVSLSFTDSTFVWKARALEPYTSKTKSYAGAIPNSMLNHPGAYRSMHPQCSYVAIGAHAPEITAGHGPHSPAYEPIRKLIALNAKMILVGCASSSPGFTTAHLAEIDLGHHRRAVFPGIFAASSYLDNEGRIQIFQRNDMGMCSNSFWKFYAHYVRAGILKASFIGEAYSILAPARECYELEKTILASNPKFNICENASCITCNALRWDRIHHAPGLILRKAISRVRKAQGQ